MSHWDAAKQIGALQIGDRTTMNRTSRRNGHHRMIPTQHYPTVQ
jgi:hypothetical protein